MAYDRPCGTPQLQEDALEEACPIFGRPFAIGPFSLCLSVLSVTLVYCGQTVGWNKMKLGKEVGLGPATFR